MAFNQQSICDRWSQVNIYSGNSSVTLFANKLCFFRYTNAILTAQTQGHKCGISLGLNIWIKKTKTSTLWCQILYAQYLRNLFYPAPILYVKLYHEVSVKRAYTPYILPLFSSLITEETTVHAIQENFLFMSIEESEWTCECVCNHDLQNQ